MSSFANGSVFSTISDVQENIAAAARQAGVQLFDPSEYGDSSEEETEDGMFAAKAKMQGQLKALGIPYAAFYTGPFSDFAWVPYVLLTLPWIFYRHTELTTGIFQRFGVLSGKVSIGGDGNCIRHASRLEFVWRRFKGSQLCTIVKIHLRSYCHKHGICPLYVHEIDFFSLLLNPRPSTITLVSFLILFYFGNANLWAQDTLANLIQGLQYVYARTK
jgi:hypothetical protein